MAWYCPRFSLYGDSGYKGSSLSGNITVFNANNLAGTLWCLSWYPTLLTCKLQCYLNKAELYCFEWLHMQNADNHMSGKIEAF